MVVSGVSYCTKAHVSDSIGGIGRAGDCREVAARAGSDCPVGAHAHLPLLSHLCRLPEQVVFVFSFHTFPGDQSGW